jgi:hypothetical protein
MTSVFPVRGRPTSEGISERISLTSSTILERPLDGKERKPGNTGVCHCEFAEILLHQNMDELRERSRRWGRNQDFIKTPASKCIKVFLFIIKLMHIILVYDYFRRQHYFNSSPYL